ncbi:MAG: FtsX-like permease family protein [Clostridiaceae bacterium]|nr:ABC transporter permease [Eubacteriales bacterium]
MVNEVGPAVSAGKKREKGFRRGRLFTLFLRQVRGSLGRYLSIVVITALGVAFFTGLRSIGSDMRLTAQGYFRDTCFMDIRLLSTAGFTENDLSAVRGMDGVLEALPAYSCEALAQVGSKTPAVRFHSLVPGGTRMNLPTLTEGRMPEKSGECLMDPYFMKQTGLSVGDAVSFVAGGNTELSDMLATDRFTIVGVAESPLYISYDRGASTVGSGETDAYCYILFDDFAFSVYTELDLSVSRGFLIDRYSDAYDAVLAPVEDALEVMGGARSELRYAEIVSEGQEELDDAKAEVADAERELADAAQELEDARKKLDDGWSEYFDAEETFLREISDAKAKLRSGRKQYQKGVADCQQGLIDYETAERDAWTQYYTAVEEVRAGAAEYESGLAAYREAHGYYAALDGALAGGNTPQAAAAVAQLAPSASKVDKDLASALSYYANAPSDQTYAIARQAVGGFGASLSENKAKLDGAEKKLDKAETQLTDARAQVEQELADARLALDDAKSELDAAQAELDKNQKKLSRAERDGRKKLDDAKKELEDGEAEYADGNAEYLEQKADAEIELADARIKIADGERELRELKVPEWYVLDQDENLGFNSFEQDAGRMDALSRVVPAIFFLVVALVVMTSMTRLVDNDRSHIGTLKSLGYSKAAVASLYLLYAISASILGCAAGAFWGPELFPRIVFNAYSVMYTLPKLSVRYDAGLMVLSALIAILSAALPAWLVCLSSLKSTPAELIKPRAPRPGKRILLERITFLWKRVSFSEKVSLRNLFRYKKRFLMTVFGVAACTALMFTGFGLNDAITLILPKQFGELQSYDVRLALAKNPSDAERNAVNRAIQGNPGITLSTSFLQKNMDITENGSTMTAVLTVPLSPDTFPAMISLRERVSGAALSLDDGGVIVTEKLADILSVRIGDTFTAVDGDGDRFTFTVSGIAENYVAHYIYLSPALYNKIFSEPAEENTVLLKLSKAENATELCERLLGMDGVAAVSLAGNVRGSMQKVMDALLVIVLVLIFSAAALVFVVLWSLNTINLEERARELATLKLLGFYNGELAVYIYRENVWLTLLGIAAGLFMGVGLQRYVLSTTEVNMLMFCRDILPQSYLYSAALTLLFAAFVNLIMLPHFRKIDMVSSLKSVE